MYLSMVLKESEYDKERQQGVIFTGRGITEYYTEEDAEWNVIYTDSLHISDIVSEVTGLVFGMVAIVIADTARQRRCYSFGNDIRTKQKMENSRYHSGILYGKDTITWRN